MFSRTALVSHGIPRLPRYYMAFLPGVSVFHLPNFAEASPADMPARFAFIFEYPVLGGEILLRIWEEAKTAGAAVRETALTRGSYTVYVVEVDQIAGSLNP